MKWIFVLTMSLWMAACGLSLHPGATEEGTIVQVSSPDLVAAKREALTAVMPLFMTPEEEKLKHELLEKLVFSKPNPFIGKKSLSKKKDKCIELKMSALAAVFQQNGLSKPEGFASNDEVVLIAFGDRSKDINWFDQFAADSYGTALFGLGIASKDADDKLLPLKDSLRSKNESDLAIEVKKNGWPWLATSASQTKVEFEQTASTWRAKIHLGVGLYALSISTGRINIEVDASSVEISSAAAMTGAIVQAAQQAALLTQKELISSRKGRRTLAVLVQGTKDLRFLKSVINDLRQIKGVQGATLVSWRSLDGMVLIHVYTKDRQIDGLTADLLQLNSNLRMESLETEDDRLTISDMNSTFTQGDE